MIVVKLKLSISTAALEIMLDVPSLNIHTKHIAKAILSRFKQTVSLKSKSSVPIQKCLKNSPVKFHSKISINLKVTD